MRRLIAAVTLATIALMQAVPALAQSAPVLKDTTDAKARIDSYAQYIADTAMLVSFDDVGRSVVLGKGLSVYVDNWDDVFNDATTKGGLTLREFSPVVGNVTTANDSSYGESVDGYNGACIKYKDFLLKAQKLADRIMATASAKTADAETQQKLAAIMRSVSAIAMNSMILSSVVGSANGFYAYGNSVCARAVGDMYFAFRHPPNDTARFTCLANRLARPEQPSGGSGGSPSECPDTTTRKIRIATTMPNCLGQACTAEIVTYDTAYKYYDWRGIKADVDANLVAYEKVLADQDTKLTEIEGKVKASEADAAKAADLLKKNVLGRGTALSLPLPLSDITLEGVIGRVINALLGIVGAVALLMFVWGGVTWMTAAGSQEKVAKAKTTITWAAIGLIAIFSSYAILNLVIETFSK